MATRCNLTEHGNCTICTQFVGPWSGYHIHTAPWHNKPSGVICNTCYGIIIASSQFTLRAVHQADLHFDNEKELRDILATRAILAFQDELHLN